MRGHKSCKWANGHKCEGGSAGTNQSTWTNAARRKHSPIAILRTRLQTRHRRGELASFLARGSPDSPPRALSTPSSILILFPTLFRAFCVHSPLHGYISRWPEPRPFYFQSMIAPPLVVEQTQARKAMMRYLPLVDPQLTSIRPQRHLIRLPQSW